MQASVITISTSNFSESIQKVQKRKRETPRRREKTSPLTICEEIEEEFTALDFADLEVMEILKNWQIEQERKEKP